MVDLNDKNKTIVKILLEFKHLTLFIDANFSKELKKILKELFPEFQSNLHLCLEMYKENLYNDDDDDDDFSQFLKQQEIIFGSNEKFCIVDRFGNIKQSITNCVNKYKSAKTDSKSTKNTRANNNSRDSQNTKLDLDSNKNEDILDADNQLNKDDDDQRLANFSSNKKSTVSEDRKGAIEAKSRRKCVLPKKYVSRIVSSGESGEDSDNSDTDDCKSSKETKSKRKIVFSKKSVSKIISIKKSDDESGNTDTDSNNDMFGIPIEYSCLNENCKFKCYSSTQLKAHEIRNHLKRIVKCSQTGCGQEFESTDELNCHVEKVHGLFQCTNEKCNIKFPNQYKLKMHIKENHKKEYITCKLCDKSYKTRVHLKKHIRVMHVEGEYKCKHENCDFIAKFRKDLTNHKSTRHLLKVCPFPDCGRLVPPNCLKRHLGVHNNVKNYFCSWPDCGKSFNEGKSLKDHVRMHLNFKRFKCKWPDCVYACEQKSNLITHIRVRHFKLPQTKKKQLEMKISLDSFPDPFDFIEVCSEDIRI